MPSGCAIRTIYDLEYYCNVAYDEDNYEDLSDFGGYDGQGGRCLTHTIEPKGDDLSDDGVGCLLATCNTTGNKVTVSIEGEDYVCDTDGEDLTINTSSYEGTVTCPQDIDSFCDTSNQVYTCDAKKCQ